MMTMKCPVCNTEYNDSIRICTTCRFHDLNKVFCSSDEKMKWESEVLIPFRELYQKEQEQKVIYSPYKINREPILHDPKNVNRIREVIAEMNEKNADVMSKYNHVAFDEADDETRMQVEKSLAFFGVSEKILEVYSLKEEKFAQDSALVISESNVYLYDINYCEYIYINIPMESVKKLSCKEGQTASMELSFKNGKTAEIQVKKYFDLITLFLDKMIFYQEIWERQEELRKEKENTQEKLKQLIAGYIELIFHLDKRMNETTLSSENKRKIKEILNQKEELMEMIKNDLGMLFTIGTGRDGMRLTDRIRKATESRFFVIQQEMQDVIDLNEILNPLLENDEDLLLDDDKVLSEINSLKEYEKEIGSLIEHFNHMMAGNEKEDNKQDSENNQQKMDKIPDRKWSSIIAVSAGFAHTVGLKKDGTVVATGDNIFGRCNVESWKEIIAVSTNNCHTVGLKKDGTVVATGYNKDGRCKVRSWNGIIAVSAGEKHTVGLKKDGTVVATGDNEYGNCDVASWKEIIAVSTNDCYTVGLKKDGTVVATGSNEYGGCDVESWKEIIAVSTNNCHTVGLKKDGTVVATGYNKDGRCKVRSWNGIIAVSAGEKHTVGLKKDGTVVATGNNKFGQCNVRSWKEIIAVSAGESHTVGLKKDGTVVATGDNIFGRCNVESWSNIIAASAGEIHTVGLKKDGTVVVTGANDYGQCNVEI